MNDTSRYMSKCLDLARQGYGMVHPNPLVGAVLVKRGDIVATGYHKRFGGAHAERDCLRKAGRDARGSTLYVNLEPCIHHGKTPPCVDAIIAAGVKRVYVAMKDPNPQVRGRGLSALRRAGIEVHTGLLGSDARKLNERFVWWHTYGTPYVGMKWAQSLDGYVADSSGRSKWITGREARRYAHYLRSGYEGILVGAGTVLKDDPRLTVRKVEGRDPVRIILDGRLRVHGDEKVFQHRSGRTILLTRASKLRSGGPALRRLLHRGVEVLGTEAKGSLPPKRVLRVLAGEGISSVLIEGGPATLRAFFDARAFNKYHIFLRASILGGGMQSLPVAGPAKLRSLAATRGSDVLMFEGGDLLIEGGPVR